MSDDIKYEYKTVQAMRGMENRSIAKAQNEGGWELFDQTQGTLRTTLKFRRVQPETFLSKAWSAFRGLAPAKQRVVAAGMAVLLVLAAVSIGTAAALDKGSTNAENSATKSTEAATVNEKLTASATPTSSEKTSQVIGAETSATGSSEAAAANEESSPAASGEFDQVINAKNNKDFAALLAVTDYCDPSIAEFADKYEGRKIELDGSIKDLQKYNAGYDILLGNAGPKTAAGPAFKYENVNMSDLKFPGTSVPSLLAKGDKFRFIAEVGEYDANRGCLFFLTPVSTAVR